jgi:dTMP kinase
MFITFEGPEGSGKSTQVRLLASKLLQLGQDVLVTREPGGTPIGEQIRDVIHSLKNTDMQERTEILLFQASRAQLVAQVIRPHLLKGGVVLCDRYADSTLAYQGYGYGGDLEQLRNLIAFATGGLQPDLTLLLDMDAEAGLKRRISGGEWNRLDALDLSFHRRVREGYHCLVQASPQRWVIIDADQPVQSVQVEIQRVVLDRLNIQG